MSDLTIETARPMSEADLCAAFISDATKPRRDQPTWIAYPETEGFDILMVRQEDGVQVGIEAKLALNSRVVSQVLPSRWEHINGSIGPDYRAVLVPQGKSNRDLVSICDALGIVVIEYRPPQEADHICGPAFRPHLPIENHWSNGVSAWHEWLPQARCPLPDYIPDVIAGAPAPVALTAWKVKAIKLMVMLEDGPVTRADFKNLQLSPTMWLSPKGWLHRTGSGWIAGERTPDLRRQHPTNFEQIQADKARWLVGDLLAGRAALASPATGEDDHGVR